MAFVHHPLLAIYTSSAVMTAFNIGLILYQRRTMRSIGVELGALKTAVRREMDDIRQEIADLHARLDIIEEKRRVKRAA